MKKIRGNWVYAMGYHGILGCLHSSIISMLWVIMVHGVAIFKWGVMVSLLISCEFLFCAFNVKAWSLNWLLEFQMRMWYYLSILLSFQFFLFCAFNVKVWSLNWLLEFQMRMWYYLSILLSFQFSVLNFSCKENMSLV